MIMLEVVNDRTSRGDQGPLAGVIPTSTCLCADSSGDSGISMHRHQAPSTPPASQGHLTNVSHGYYYYYYYLFCFTVLPMMTQLQRAGSPSCAQRTSTSMYFLPLAGCRAANGRILMCIASFLLCMCAASCMRAAPSPPSPI